MTYVLTQGLIDAHEQFKSTLGEADREYQGILALCTEAAQLASQYSLLNENPYTSIQVRQILEIYLCLVVLSRFLVCLKLRVLVFHMIVK